MKFLYKYPQRRYPYEELVDENVHRDRNVEEYEILDTDIFDDDRYWDVFMEVSFSFVWSIIDNNKVSVCERRRRSRECLHPYYKLQPWT
jgi:hypothetical protein